MGDMLSTIKEYQNTSVILSDKISNLDKEIQKEKRKSKGRNSSTLSNLMKRRDDLAIQLACAINAINSMTEYQAATIARQAS